MDSVTSTLTVEGIASLVAERIIAEGRLNDLANANLMTIEEQSIEAVDQVARLVMSQLIGKQSQQATAVTACPKCGKAMQQKPDQHRSLQSRRGKVSFKTEVFHCEACRLDFFPSDENTSV